MSTSDLLAKVDLTSSNGLVEFTIADARFRERDRGVGSLHATLEPGIYQIEMRAGSRIEQKLVALRPGQSFSESVEHMDFAAVAPVEGTSTSHEPHQDAARELSSGLREGPAGLLVMVRNQRGRDLPIEGVSQRHLSLLDSNLEQVERFDTGWQSHPAQGWEARGLDLEPGGYVLHAIQGGDRPDAGTEVLDQSLWLSKGWTTIMFLANTSTGPAVDLASVHMTRLGDAWSPNDPSISLATELAVIGLQQGRNVLPADLMSLLLHSKFANPMLGILGAYALLLERTPDLGRLQTVVRNLNSPALVRGHPDVQALALMSGQLEGFESEPARGVTWPPMLLMGYDALIRLDGLRPGVIEDRSPAEVIAARVVVQGLWTTWRPLPPSIPRTGEAEADALRWPEPSAIEAGTSLSTEAPAPWLRTLEEAPFDEPATERVSLFLAEAAKANQIEDPTQLLDQVDHQHVCRGTGLPATAVRNSLDQITSRLEATAQIRPPESQTFRSGYRGTAQRWEARGMPQVRERMTASVVTIEPTATVVDAAKRMIQQEKGPLPVVEGGRVVAMITDRDIIARVVAAGRDPTSVTVRDVATKDLVTIGPDQDEQAARQMMAQHQLDRLLVVEEGDRLVGIISEADLRADEGPLA